MNEMTDITPGYQIVIDSIAALDWDGATIPEMTAAAWAYWYFSIQFRENLEIAYRLHPDDPALKMLMQEECATDNLSPWPEIVEAGEKIDHDEFMRRALLLSPIDEDTREQLMIIGEDYLTYTRSVDDITRAMSITSYEDGGLETVFKAMLRGTHWDTPLLQAFQHFLIKHVSFDSNPDAGHGALIRHLAPDSRITGLWMAFYGLFVHAVPELEN